MLFKKDKTKKTKKRSKSLIILLVGGFLLTISHLLKKGRFKDFEKNIRDFAREEKKEIKELKNHEEGYIRFCRDSSRLFWDYFIPHRGNAHRPKILRPRALAMIAAVLLLVKMSTATYLFLSYPQGAHMSEVLVNEVLRLINLERIAADAGELKPNAVLNQSALAKAKDLVENDYFAHTSLDGKKPWDWIDRGQYAYIYVGENLAMNFTNAQSVHQALMNSPTHKKNILNERYADVGLAMVSGEINGKTTNVLVQHFAVQSSAAPPEVKIAALPPLPTAETAASETVPPEPETVANETIEAPTAVAGETIEAPPEPKAVAGEAAPATLSAGNMPPPPPAKAEIKALQPGAKSLARADADQTPPLLQTLGDSSEKKPAEPEYIAMNAVLAEELLILPNQDKAAALPALKAVRLVNYFFLTVLLLMSALLAVNIFVRVEVQHKPVIVQTLALILFISGLLYFKFHIIESGVAHIFII